MNEGPPAEVAQLITVNEPYVTMQLLPGCRNCGEKHPLAFNPPLPANLCPGCGLPAGQPGNPHTERAEIVGPLARLLDYFRKAAP